MNFLASALLVLIGAGMVLASDLLIRARGLDGLNGINAQSWDSAGTLVMVVGLIGFIVSFVNLFD